MMNLLRGLFIAAAFVVVSANALAELPEIPRHPPFRELYLARDKSLVALIDNGVVRSSDQGKTWTRVFEEDRHRRSGFFVRQKKQLLLVIRGGNIYASKDEGKTWRMRGISADVNWSSYLGYRGGKYLNKIDDRGYIFVCDQDKLHISENGGKSWSSQKPLPTLLGPTQSILNIAFDKNKVYLLSQHALIVSEDRAKTWNVVTAGKFPEIFGTALTDPLSHVSFDASSNGDLFLIGKGQIFVSSDGGVHWEFRDFNIPASPSEILFSRRDAIYIAAINERAPSSQRYKVFRSKDNRTAVEFSAHHPTQDLQLDKQANIYIVTEKNIYKTIDEGASWEVINNNHIKWYEY
ncbi:WD40/YVTN/BNR-like repeat-containing protein [Undibacterium umbellatum]|uniref:DUF6242 domain-containing protein n=1 Tax=Undibacterium umbellatum TaxID=2762300 RepID=A0ABR6ZA43_9BURK|nr:sialidase family protein [Undibacterium umbellatum]MBC3908057.1 hypothetical protein [Undibacterium umbellatum]